MDMKLERLLKRKKILVIGDVMLDMYYSGDVKRISPEAPVPVFRIKAERFVLGGAANVASNLIAAGQTVSILTIIGDDEYGQILLDRFLDQGIDTSFVLKTERSTTVKTRFLAGNNQQVMRLDVEDTYDLSAQECRKLLDGIEGHIGRYDLIVFSDYLKGLMTFDFTQGVIERARQYGIKAIIDVKDKNYGKYKGAYLLKPNLTELRALSGLPADNDQDIILA